MLCIPRGLSGRVKGGAAGDSDVGSFSLGKKRCLVPGVQKVPMEVLVVKEGGGSWARR